MSSRFWSKFVLACRGAPQLIAITCAVALTAPLLLNEATAAGANNRHNNKVGSPEIDTEHMFGFTEGSDIGEAGERELEAETTGRFGKQDGSYNAVATGFQAKYTLSEHLQIGPSATVAYYDIAGVTGLDDRRQGRFQAVSVDVRYRLLDRERAPFGLTFIIVPRWGFADDISSASARQYGAEFLIAADRELVHDRIFAAFNLRYAPDVTHVYGADQTARESTFGVDLALAGQVSPGLFLGAEARFLQHYEGVGLNHFAGQAVYVGPTLYTQLGGSWFISVAWNVQAAGGAAGIPGALDVTNFERYQARLQMGVSF